MRLWPATDPGDGLGYERQLLAQGYATVAGVDEAGRGPLAGPVVAACVVLPSLAPCGYRDSKVLLPAAREALYVQLAASGARIGVGVVSPARIDRVNILKASLEAMALAVADLGPPPDVLLVDGRFRVPAAIPQHTLVRGEEASRSIAAASIVAKVLRDRLMDDLHDRFPQYNFRSNKGYPTAEHRRALAVHGPCAAHRRTFRGVREQMSGGDTP
ncbi:MAG: ribonuclease HII [Thermodesulfobacteriota bacterium]